MPSAEVRSRIALTREDVDADVGRMNALGQRLMAERHRAQGPCAGSLLRPLGLAPGRRLDRPNRPKSTTSALVVASVGSGDDETAAITPFRATNVHGRGPRRRTLLPFVEEHRAVVRPCNTVIRPAARNLAGGCMTRGPASPDSLGRTLPTARRRRPRRTRTRGSPPNVRRRNDIS